MKFEMGAEIPFVSMGVIQSDWLRSFSIAGADPNPIHLDDTSAKKAGLKGPIAHGMLLATLLASRFESLTWDRKQYFLKSSQFRFKAMTFLGEEIFAGGKISQISGNEIEIELHAKNQTEIKTIGKFRLQSLG